MIKQSEFMKEVGISHKRLCDLHEQGLFLPKGKHLTGNALLYSEEQVQELKDYLGKNDSNDTGLTIIEFADRVGVDRNIITNLRNNGVLKEHHRDNRGYCRYTEEQVDKFLAGDYDVSKKEGYYNRRQVAELFGVSVALVGVWVRKGLLTSSCKGYNGMEFYEIEEVNELFKNKDLWVTNTLLTKKSKRMMAEQS